jgi:AraC-like DNA-binding protein
MKFTRLIPHPDLDKLIECYWMMKSEDTVPKVEKIIPDGFTEIIFNYGSVFKAKLNGAWQTQKPNLLAGQIRKYFYLENTGDTGSFAIKLKPAALTQLFGLNMEEYLDRIVGLDNFTNPQLAYLSDEFLPFENENILKARLDSYFLMLSRYAAENPLERELDLIFSSNGTASIRALCEIGGLGERKLQRLFKKYVGLSPKYYSRIIRFNYIFSLIKDGKTSWAELVYKSGYYDQSHFIRNFKNFTGVDPSEYFFQQNNMANFFLYK